MDIIHLSSRPILAPTEWIIILVALLFAVAKLVSWGQKLFKSAAYLSIKSVSSDQDVPYVATTCKSRHVDELIANIVRQQSDIEVAISSNLNKILQHASVTGIVYLEPEQQKRIEKNLIPLLEKCIIFYQKRHIHSSNWFEFHRHKKHFEQLAKLLLQLKNELPEPWLAVIRSDVQILGELSHCYFNQQEQLLETSYQ